MGANSNVSAAEPSGLVRRNVLKWSGAVAASALAFGVDVSGLRLVEASQAKLAKLMGTSRSQVSRLLDPEDGNVTLSTLRRAAEMVGRKVRLELV